MILVVERKGLRTSELWRLSSNANSCAYAQGKLDIGIQHSRKWIRKRASRTHTQTHMQTHAHRVWE
jgi:hypothetical protein